MDKISKKSAKELGLKKYFTGNCCPKGHISERSVSTGQCCECERLRSAARRAADPDKCREMVRKSATKNRAKNKQKRKSSNDLWRAKNADVIREKRRVYYEQNAERLKQKARDARASNVEDRREKSRLSRVKNREKINERQTKRRRNNPEKYREYQARWMAKNGVEHRKKLKDRRKSDPIYAFNGRARCLIRGAMVRSGFRKAKKTEELLGCSLEQFRMQIERQFLRGMGWHNMHLWHIDHVVPVSKAKTLEEAESLNKAGNLRPFWAKDNKAKSAKITHLL